MSSQSILDTILNQAQTDKIGRLDVMEIITALFTSLNDREQDILKRRFGLKQPEKATLEEIGQTHNLTRERIRQIETGSINKIKKLEKITEIVSDLRTLVSQLLENHGGTMDKNYLFAILTSLLSDSTNATSSTEEIYRNHFDFILGKILDSDFKEIHNSPYFNSLLSLRSQDFDHLEEIAEGLLNHIKEAKRLYATSELLGAVSGLPAYKKHEARLQPQTTDSLDLTSAFERFLPSEDISTANHAKPLYALLQAISDIEQNKFGNWGHRDWRDVKPKTINDKIFLVLQNNGKPMHYQDIAKKINETGFDGKSVNTATVHNELILDEKYVLVGRGLYALQSWGYTKGTVADIIESLLKKTNQPMTKQEIADEVMKQRLVKKTTIDLALMNKKRFQRLSGGKYALVS